MGYSDKSHHAFPATKFVRDFASYAQMAFNEPVHILKHGRPSLSLVATNRLQGLLHSGDSTEYHAISSTKLDMVLDHVKTLVMILDDQLHILRVNLAAREAFKLSEEVLGASLQSTITDARQEFILRALERVRDTGVAENIEFDSFDRPIRTFQCYITTFPGGLAMFTEDVTHTVALRNADAIADAYAGLLEVTPGLAHGMLNVRGMISSASQSLSDLLDTAEDRLIGVRLTALCETSFRGEIGDRVEALLSSAEPFSTHVNLLPQGSKVIPAVLSAYPHVNYGRKPGATFLIRSEI